MSKFKKGDHVVNKWNSDIIYKVEVPEFYIHNSFPNYMKLEGESSPVREDDYVLVDSLKELVIYAAIGIGALLVILAAGGAVYCFANSIVVLF